MKKKVIIAVVVTVVLSAVAVATANYCPYVMGFLTGAGGAQ